MKWLWVAIAMVATAPFTLFSLGYWDRGTTLGLKQPLASIAITAAGLLVACPFLRYWFKPREDLHRVPDWNLKHDAPGRWALKGAAAAAFFGGMSGGLIYAFLCSLAPFVPGPITTSTARLEQLEQSHASRDRCKLYAELSRDGSETFRACVATTFGAPLLREDVEIGTPVRLLIKENAIGRVLLAVTPCRVGT
jgi:hypothetical protein